MDRRFYQRTQVDIVSNFIIKNNKPGFREFSGMIRDISEGGIKIELPEGDYPQIIEGICEGDKIYFQAVDEYELFKENRVDVFGGEVKVVRVNRTDVFTEIGCVILAQSSELLDYIQNKRMSLFFS